jgi:Icc protein
MSKITRRNFIKTALVATTLPLISSAKSENTQNLKFIHITDSHMDLGNDASVEAIEIMVKFINENYKDLDFVLFGGDNFNNNTKNFKDAKVFKKIIDNLHCKSYLVRGNKESKHSLKFQEIFIDSNELLVSNNDWLLELKGYNILGLDSCITNENNGAYTQQTINFAKKVLNTKKPTLILNHHPYTNYWGGTEKADLHKYVLNNTAQVQKEIFSYDNLLLTLSGHKHIDSVSEIKGTKVIVTRGFVRPLDLEMYPMRYIQVNSSTIEEKLIYTS